MSYYRFTNNTKLGGKYIANWPAGYNPQKYNWKHWNNATGYDMFIPENSSSERSTVHYYLQNVSGITRTVGWFGSADGRNIVTTVARSPNPNWCHSSVPPTAGDVTYGYSTAEACPAGTLDRFGSKYGDSLESLTESQDNPYYNTAASSNSATNFYLSSRYTFSKFGNEDIYDYSISWCSNSSFPYRAYQIRHCYLQADRGRCWDQCGNSAPAVIETLVIGGGGGGGGSYRDYWPGGERLILIEDENGNVIGTDFAYVEPYDNVYYGGGGGAGGFRSANATIEVNTTYTITVGGGGSASGTGGTSTISGTSGYNSGNTVSIQAAGGGGGGANGNEGAAGGSGGGGSGMSFTSGGQTNGVGGAGNTPSTSPSQGNNGGASSYQTGFGGGGGGAGEAGNTDGSGHGGDGASSSITGSSVTYSGGGAGAGGGSNGGTGGGGNSPTNQAGTAGGTNLGGGGGAGGTVSSTGTTSGGTGGSGVVIIRYPDFLANATTVTGSPTFTQTGGYRIYKFTGSGSILWN